MSQFMLIENMSRFFQGNLTLKCVFISLLTEAHLINTFGKSTLNIFLIAHRKIRRYYYIEGNNTKRHIKAIFFRYSCCNGMPCYVLTLTCYNNVEQQVWYVPMPNKPAIYFLCSARVIFAVKITKFVRVSKI